MKIALLLFAVLGFTAPAHAQEATSLIIQGWTTSTGKDGVNTYSCSSEICAAGSVVSYKVQPHRPELTLALFETHHRGLADRYRGSGRIRDVRISEARERVVEGVRVLQINREVEWSDGTRTFSIEARLIGPDKSFSLVSDSPELGWTAKNFEGFLLPLADIAGIRNAE